MPSSGERPVQSSIKHTQVSATVLYAQTRTQHEAHLEPCPVRDAICLETRLHVDLIPTHAHHEPFHLIRRESGGVCALDGITGDLPFWDLDASVAEAGVVREELDIHGNLLLALSSYIISSCRRLLSMIAAVLERCAARFSPNQLTLGAGAVGD